MSSTLEGSGTTKATSSSGTVPKVLKFAKVVNTTLAMVPGAASREKLASEGGNR